MSDLIDQGDVQETLLPPWEQKKMVWFQEQNHNETTDIVRERDRTRMLPAHSKDYELSSKDFTKDVGVYFLNNTSERSSQ